MIQSASLENIMGVPQDRIPNVSIKEKANLIKVADEPNVNDNLQQQKDSFTPKSIIKAIEEINKDLEPIGRKLEYSIHERTNRILVKVIDIQTEKVVKEIPDEKLMNMMADFCEASGILVDERI